MIRKRLHRYAMLKRYGQIIEVLQKYGFGYIVDQIGLSSIRDLTYRFKNKDKMDKLNTSGPVRARKILEELGPTYIKFGQLLSIRHDVVPLEYATEFAKLQDEAPSFEFEEVELIIREELGHSIEELFDFFEEKPLACASIGQVHRAKTKSGDDVVVKVQRPGIKEVIQSDLDIMYSIARLLEEHIPEATLYRPVEIVDELAHSILAEIDYTQEGWNADRFADNFRENSQVHIPRVYWDYTNTRVLTLEYIKGIKGSHVDLLNRQGFDRSNIASVVVKAFMQQVFEDGFFHADLHPGNILIMEDGTVAFLDFGMAGHLSSEICDIFLDGVVALVNGDSSSFIELLRDMGCIDSYADTRPLKVDIESFRSKYYGKALKKLDASIIIEELIGTLRDHQVTMPHNIALLVRGIVAVESFGLIIDPDLNFSELLEPYAKNELKKRFYPQNLARKAYSNISSWARLFQKAPTKISHILDHAENGYLKIKLESEESNRLVSEIDVASNRLSISLIISALIVASSLVIQTHMKPFIGGAPLLGTFSFVIASIFGLWLVFNIFKTGRV
ncbi:AarF/ABC1/UbiB kinase family protein [Methanosarcina sp. Z-7115]|uniref:AarF/ABC1/UbiB kinase family protein n=1 Tax=Methanosarcina baikalica TaxID=3073890 RepID=A0ABU2CXY9_9EURY|nr:AarF/ABC1/UbiB kinase family protein [Methanosarcina sp. Z-7115]MDR7664609.1 AarF/ABC1/UbiB kinase family protein [Methanosarcina sp. Z-7115]